VKDRTVEGQIRTAQAAPGTPADGVYMASLSVAALISEGSRLYEAGEYAQALAVYEAAAARPDGRHLRVFNGLYLSNIQLNRAEGAEAAFGRLVLLGLTTNSLAVKFLFKPGSTDFWPDPKINAAYPMWIRVVARESLAAKACITVAGHTSRTGSDQANERLSVSRAVAIQKRLEGAAPEIAGRLQSTGFGFRENLVGTGSDDVRDALDRRVEFRVRSC
jgi:outer membrane protein OmpA-like peptidoglycan-associated protein